MWFIIKNLIYVAIVMWFTFLIAEKNPYVAAKIKKWHDATIAWSYRWIPVLYAWLKDKWVNR